MIIQFGKFKTSKDESSRPDHRQGLRRGYK
jgi:hypothetical protein